MTAPNGNTWKICDIQPSTSLNSHNVIVCGERGGRLNDWSATSNLDQLEIAQRRYTRSSIGGVNSTSTRTEGQPEGTLVAIVYRIFIVLYAYFFHHFSYDRP